MKILSTLILLLCFVLHLYSLTLNFIIYNNTYMKNSLGLRLLEDVLTDWKNHNPNSPINVWFNSADYDISSVIFNLDIEEVSFFNYNMCFQQSNLDPNTFSNVNLIHIINCLDRKEKHTITDVSGFFDLALNPFSVLDFNIPSINARETWFMCHNPDESLSFHILNKVPYGIFDMLLNKLSNFRPTSLARRLETASATTNFTFFVVEKDVLTSIAVHDLLNCLNYDLSYMVDMQLNTWKEIKETAFKKAALKSLLASPHSLNWSVVFKVMDTFDNEAEAVDFMLMECQNNLEFLDKIYDHASKVDLYDYASDPHGQNYAIHIMWLNANLKENQKYLFPSTSVSELEYKYLKQILRWSVLNPKASTVVWYDGAMVRPDSLQNTAALLQDLQLKQNKIYGEIRFKDIQNLNFMQKLTAEQRNALYKWVYLRADLLRLVASLHELEEFQTELDYVVYSDFDVVPMSEAVLFDSLTIKNLNEQGIVVADGGPAGYENLFHIIKNRDEKIKEAIQRVTIERTTYMLFSAGNRNPVSLGFSRLQVGPQLIFNHYKNMFVYNFFLRKFGRESWQFREFLNVLQDGTCVDWVESWDAPVKSVKRLPIKGHNYS